MALKTKIKILKVVLKHCTNKAWTKIFFCGAYKNEVYPNYSHISVRASYAASSYHYLSTMNI